MDKPKDVILSEQDIQDELEGDTEPSAPEPSATDCPATPDDNSSENATDAEPETVATAPPIDGGCDLVDGLQDQVYNEDDPSENFLGELSSQVLQGDILGRIESNIANPTAGCPTCSIIPQVERQTAATTHSDFLPTVRGFVNEEEPVIPKCQTLLYCDEQAETTTVISEGSPEMVIQDQAIGDALGKDNATELQEEAQTEPTDEVEAFTEVTALPDGTVIFTETVTVPMSELTLDTEQGTA